MGYKYHEPLFEELSELIRDRIKETARIVEAETGALGIVLTDETKIRKCPAEQIWGGLKFGEFREVFVYEYSTLQEAYFRVNEQVFNLRFSGMSSEEDKQKVEVALGLQVLQRPDYNRDVAKIMVVGQLLEKIISLYSLSAQYLGRR